MRVGDSVRPKHDLYNRGIGVIVNVEPAAVKSHLLDPWDLMNHASI